MILNFILGFIGAVIGAAALDDEGGAILGFFIGFLGGMIVGLKKRLAALENRFEILETRQQAVRVEKTATGAEKAEPAGPQPPTIPHRAPKKKPGVGKKAPQKPVFTPPPRAKGIPVTATAGPGRTSAKASASKPKGPEPIPNAVQKAVDAVRDFFTGGNTVVRVGIVVLFFGVAFLLKYASDRSIIPIELRLAGILLGGMAMLAFGWKFRSKRPGYALALQGGGVGILYLTIFAAARLYRLFPPVTALAVMVAVVILSGILAVMQNSQALAFFGAAGGFLAPVLTSSGGGSHILLFSYYALLNAGILGIAWFRAWRPLNLLGFVFTFSIGSAWGVQSYRPDHFASTEPFLILFFLFYVAVSVLFAHRQPPKLKGFVDGALVFGLPIVVFTLQAGLVRKMEFGLPLSALSLSAFYIFLAAALHRRKIEGMRLLTEAFLALGVVFGSLAVPLALDGRWTAAAWAMEGAALVWIGIRQERLLARNFGLLLQIGAGVVFFSTLNRPGSVIPVFNGLYLGCLAISLAALFSAFYLDKNASRLRKWEKGFHWFMLFWGLVWWFGAGIHEIDEHLPYRHLQPSFLLFFVASFQIMGLLFRTPGWKALRVPSAFLLPVLCLFAAFDLIDWPRDHPFARWGLIPWGLGFFTHFFLMKTLEKAWKPRILNLWHIGGILLFIGILSWESGWWTHRLIHDGEIWRFAPLGIIPALTVLVFMKEGERMPWPVKAFPLQYLGWTPALLSLYLWVWAIAGCFRRGDPDPLPYFPILNPLELSAALALFTVIGWAWTAGTSRRPDFDPETFRVIHGFTGAGVFLWLNSIVARTLHHWGGVPFTGSALFRSVRFQAAASLLWTSTAFAIMAFGSRRQLRKVWYGGAILLGAVVVKLFFIDLSGSGTVGRIISFTGVGILILIIGFICPLPGETEASSPNKKEI